jgi:hypothetical protein
MSSQGLENVPGFSGTSSQGLENVPRFSGTSSQGLLLLYSQTTNYIAEKKHLQQKAGMSTPPLLCCMGN